MLASSQCFFRPVLASSGRLSLDYLFLVPISIYVSPSNLQGLFVPSFVDCLWMKEQVFRELSVVSGSRWEVAY